MFRLVYLTTDLSVLYSLCYSTLISCCLSTSMQITLVKPLTVFPPTSNLSVLQSV